MWLVFVVIVVLVLVIGDVVLEVVVSMFDVLLCFVDSDCDGNVVVDVVMLFGCVLCVVYMFCGELYGFVCVVVLYLVDLVMFGCVCGCLMVFGFGLGVVVWFMLVVCVVFVDVIDIFGYMIYVNMVGLFWVD